MLCLSSPQPFRHQGPVSRKIVFPRAGWGWRGWFRRCCQRQVKLRSLTGPPLTSCCSAWFLTGRGLVPVSGLGGRGDPCYVFKFTDLFFCSVQSNFNPIASGFLQQNCFEIYPWCYTSIVHFFLLWNSIPLCGYMTVCLSVHLFIDIWVVSSFRLLRIIKLFAINLYN